jgi:hypothetical protein
LKNTHDVGHETWAAYVVAQSPIFSLLDRAVAIASRPCSAVSGISPRSEISNWMRRPRHQNDPCVTSPKPPWPSW